MFTHVLCAVDGSGHAQRAVTYAADQARKDDARLTILHVNHERPYAQLHADLAELERIEHIHVTEKDAMRAIGENLVAAAASHARNEGATHVETEVREGHTAGVIADFVRRNNVDLIVMGTRGLNDLPGLFLGSVSHRVVHLVDVPVMLVR